ncbi:MAG: tRNA (adenosine(37)-N6)-threonylcarbamoyltransferase complex ATPase subunit type 1 TsaE [Gammaproteobacteria bacterium]|nr:tRNA (adenosine(37)-N6)-threonylcarbamoyltransferase complex ATPase subunit type 1 TsaE [Gammaproteobacteria bacterium]
MFISDTNAMVDFSQQLFKACANGGVIFLNGNLGVGKTTLVRGFLQANNKNERVRSPTYTLMEQYETDKFSVIHMDLYRLSDPEELEYLAVRELIDKNTLFLIEWPEKAGGYFKNVDLEINIDYEKQGRRVELIAHSEWAIKVKDSFQ